MNKETRNFVLSLLNKYNSSQNIVDIESTIVDNTFVVGEIDGEVVELEAQDAVQLIRELCEALNILDEVCK